MNAPQSRTLDDIAQPPVRGIGTQDLVVNMFSAQGFALVQRIASAYQTSNAVPAAFRSVVIKREKRGDDYVDVEVANPSAMGNCIVAIETAQAVGMSITAVMQNANIIEGRLTWSGKFVIAAINASRRFSPLRFRITNKGWIKATYKEKGAWNRAARKFDMIEKEIEVEDIECVAWAYVMEGGRRTDEIIEGVPVSIKMAVEEGWYAKPGSKWQTSLKHLMLQYRAGSFFGNIHAPDIVMGMGRTTEEALDTLDFDQQPDGSLAVDLDKFRQESAGQDRRPQRRRQTDATDVDPSANQQEQGQAAADRGIPPGAAKAQAGGIPAQEAASASAPASQASGDAFGYTAAEVESQIHAAKDLDALDLAGDLINSVMPIDARVDLAAAYDTKREQLENPPPQRAARGPRPSVE